MSNTIISIIHPSRNRSNMAMKAIQQWVIKAVNKKRIQYILSIDTDEPEVRGYGYVGIWARCVDFIEVVTVSENNKNVVDAANAGAKKATGDILVLLSDDFDCPDKWDEFILNNIDPTKEQALRVSDGLQADTAPILTLPIITKKLYDSLGCIYHPEFTGMYADNWLYEISAAKGAIVENFTQPFLHRHWINKHRPKDETAERHHNPAGFMLGKKILDEQRKINFGLK